mgnify:CR=1 FL=1
MVHPAATKTTPALNRSILNVLNAAYQNRTAVSKLWNTAPTCALFLKKSTKTKNGKKKKCFRGNRALKGHTIKTFASGAAANAAVLVQNEALQLRCDVNHENKKYPLLPSVSKSAVALIEAAFIAYMQEAFENAIEIKMAVGKHKKVTQKCAQMGIDALNERVALATSFVPASVIPRITKNSKKKK